MATPFEQAWNLLKSPFSQLPNKNTMAQIAKLNSQKRFDPNTGELIDWDDSEGEWSFREPKTSLPRPTHLVRHISDWGDEGFYLATPEHRNFITGLSNVYFDENNNTLQNFQGNTHSNYRRQGYYEKLMRALLARGYNIESDDRNRKSQPFHEKFMQNLPPGVKLSVSNVRPDDTSIHEKSSFLYEPEIPYAENSPLKQYDIGAYPFMDLTRSSWPYASNPSDQTSLTDF